MVVMVAVEVMSICLRMKMYPIYEHFTLKNTGKQKMANQDVAAIKTEEEEIPVNSNSH